MVLLQSPTSFLWQEKTVSLPSFNLAISWYHIIALQLVGLVQALDNILSM